MNKHMGKKITVELGFEEACLIERALELYSRVGIFQFDNLTLCNSLQSKLWKDDISDKFRDRADDLKSVFNYSPPSHPSIFNTQDVQDDVRIACHMYQQFRHERYKDRIASGEQTERHHTVDEYPADICNIAGIKTPDCKINIENLNN